MALQKDLVLGLDLSTTACKAMLWDARGLPHGEGRKELDILQPIPGQFEQSAEEWWNATVLAIRQAIRSVNAGRVAAISISHQRETFVLLDSTGCPLRPAILWMDERSRPIHDEVVSALNDPNYQERTGKPLTPNLIIGKLEWLRRQEPGNLKKTAHLLDTGAYLNYRLTGKFATSTASADPTGLLDIPGRQWDPHCLSWLGLSPDQFPELYEPGQVIGTLTREAAQETGLPAGLPVVAGLGDGQANTLGSGVSSSSLASLSLGTSIITGLVSTAYKVSPAFRTMIGGMPGSYVLEMVLLAGGFTIQWFTRDLLRDQESLDELEKKASSLPPGAEGVVMIPYLNSAMNPYWDSHASGVFFGLRGFHKPEHLFRAILEGLGFELRLQLQHAEMETHLPVKQIIASGGGTHSRLWRQILANILNRPIAISSNTEAASLGAGILAAIGSGWFPSYTDAVNAMAPLPSRWIEPDPNSHTIYTRFFEDVYCALYPSLKETMYHLAGLSHFGDLGSII
ncbi:MAG TPA: xylulose kinase [Anaerolinea thermolimosa]|uniref:Xylulose kinase n=1 Tax=Anaerolinea thermolimosa TaxID=229919 RepID=A0A3D1JGM0_9CHLR|nr:FGGY family carbohydrate kinase [Anaerolinea thermolimosa]GAP06200.1 sugar (pentulose and hexulose) kinases [Anaerolinea thermolimosa]HCE16746.1 xylulose kinase [Anaerolinea thermolimosa]